MPRKSTAALTVATRVDGRSEPLAPGPDLAPDVAAIFAATVAAAPTEHFSELDRVALTEFSQAAARCQRAEAAIAVEGDVVQGRPNPWLTVVRDARHQLTNLLPKLRLCPSARIQAKQVRPNRSPAALPPWEQR